MANPISAADETTAARVPADALRAFAEGVLRAAGALPEHAARVADNLVDANLHGIDSHGVPRLVEIYVERLERGLTNPRPAMRVVQESPSTALVDADNGLGAVAGALAVTLAIEKARETGTGWIAVQHSNHFGTCAYYGNLIATQGMVGFICTNAPASMAPWGGIEPFLGTNPICFCAPTRSGDPISVDMATSVVARGYVIIAQGKGMPLPEGWAIDQLGRPTTDPDEAMQGTVLPVGGHKGYALALLVELLGGVLTGSAIGPDVGQLSPSEPRLQDTGHLIGALDIARFLPLDQFYDRVEAMAHLIRTAPRAEGVDRLMLPGDPERAFREDRLNRGVPVPEPTLSQLVALGRRLGVPFPV